MERFCLGEGRRNGKIYNMSTVDFQEGPVFNLLLVGNSCMFLTEMFRCDAIHGPQAVFVA